VRSSMKFLFPMLAASLLLAACGSSASSHSSVATPGQPAGSQSGNSGSGAVVKTASNSRLSATVLVDAQGMTLYQLSAETNGKFICTSVACVKVWHPLIAKSASTPRGTVGSLGTIKRPNGALQVTYRGSPLYTFVQDTAAGQANGQGIKDVGTWSAVTTRTSKSSAPAAPASSSSSGSYGY
jgi:predicted lipoprotein with Yx(FWY)xxD motif